jgi:hypothetical protein
MTHRPWRECRRLIATVESPILKCDAERSDVAVDMRSHLQQPSLLQPKLSAVSGSSRVGPGR